MVTTVFSVDQMSSKSVAPLPSFDMSHEIDVAINKCQLHGFEFGICTASKLPVLMKAPFSTLLKEKKCFFDNCLHHDIAKAVVSFNASETRCAQSFSMDEILAMETTAHKMRWTACVEPDAKTRAERFETAFNMYERACIAWRIVGVNDNISNLKRLSQSATKPTLFTPLPNAHQYPDECKRSLSHSFAGMALCALMGQQMPLRFFSAVSVAVGWEPFHPIELASVLRLHLLIMARHTLHVKSLTYQNGNGILLELGHELAPDLDQLLDACEAMTAIVVMYHRMNEMIMIPLALRVGSPDLLLHERELIRASRPWNEVEHLAVAINRRIEDRISGVIPDPLVGSLSQTHIVGGRFLERVCAACGRWDRFGPKPTFSRCGGCRMVYYCSKACQVSDWKQHKPACKA